MVDHVGIVVDEVKFRQVFSHHLGFPLPMLPTHLTVKGWHNGTMCGCMAAIPRDSSHPTPTTTLFPYEFACTHIT